MSESPPKKKESPPNLPLGLINAGLVDQADFTIPVNS